MDMHAHDISAQLTAQKCDYLCLRVNYFGTAQVLPMSRVKKELGLATSTSAAWRDSRALVTLP